AGCRYPAQPVVVRGERIVLGDIYVHLGHENPLVADSRHRAGFAVQEGQHGIDLRVRKRASRGFESGAGRGRVDGGQVTRTAENSQAREVAPQFVIVEKEEGFVLLDRSADVSTKTISFVYWLEPTSGNRSGDR